MATRKGVHLLLHILLFILQLIEQVPGFLVEDCECGVPNIGTPFRIVGGTLANPHEFPWMVAIARSSNKQVRCSGSVINNRYILTAGHCVAGHELQSMFAFLGMHEKADGGDQYFFNKVLIHPEFVQDDVHDTNDIALIRTERVIQYSVKVRPICLPHPESIYNGHTTIVAGWGRLAFDSLSSDILRKVEVQAISLKTCLKTRIREHLADTMMCAYAKYHDACVGDSGGPLFYSRNNSKMEIIGIVSWGDECAKIGSPGVYTSIMPFISWIANSTNDAKYCSNK